MILDIKYQKLPKKKIIVKVNNDIIFSPKNIPIIAGPNGVESRELIFRLQSF